MKHSKFLTLALVLGMAAVAGAQENYKQWTGHQRLWLNTQGNGAGISANVVNFPVLVRLTSAQSAIFAAAKATGADIRFSKADTVTRLPYQIERWDTAAKAAEIWVLVDTVKADNGSQNILMHWGKADAADSSKGSAVFLTTSGFQGVYHFNQDAASPALDATANALNATPTSVTNAAGIVGPAKSFDGVGAWYGVDNSAAGALDFAEFGTYTVSAWVNANASDAHYEIVSKNDRQYALKIHVTGNFEFFEYSAGWNAARSPAIVGQWKHVVGVANAGIYHIYVDGVLSQEPLAIASGSGANAAGATNVSIGKRGDNDTRYFNGLIDEVNLSNVARSAAWIKLAYENQKAAQTLVALTQPTSLRSGEPMRGARLQAKPQGSGLLFSLPAVAAKSRLTVSDMWGRTVWSRTVDVNTASLSWDGSSLAGRPVARGMYLARLVPIEGSNRSAVWEAKVALTR